MAADLDEPDMNAIAEIVEKEFVGAGVKPSYSKILPPFIRLQKSFSVEDSGSPEGFSFYRTNFWQRFQFSIQLHCAVVFGNKKYLRWAD